MQVRVKSLYKPGPWQEITLPPGANLNKLTVEFFHCSPVELEKEKGPLAVLINGRNMLTLKGWDTELFDEDRVFYTPMMFGG